MDLAILTLLMKQKFAVKLLENFAVAYKLLPYLLNMSIVSEQSLEDFVFVTRRSCLAPNSAIFSDGQVFCCLSQKKNLAESFYEGRVTYYFRY